MDKFKFKNQENFEKIKKEAEAFYKNIGSVRCPYFNEKIAFNAKGLRHLKFKSNQQARTKTNQYPRLKLLYFVPQVLKKSHTLQEIWRTRVFEQQKTNGKWKHLMKDVVFYGFTAVLDNDNIRIKVIIKTIDEKKYFWSVIPYWGIDKKTSQRTLRGDNIQEYN